MHAAFRPLLLTVAFSGPILLLAQTPPAQTATQATNPSATQTATPTATASAPQPGAAPLATLRTTTQLTVLDVVVTDKDGKIVHGLKADDFTVQESNVPQQLVSFEDNTRPAAKPRPALPPMPAGVYTNYSQAPADAAVTVLLIDSFNTPAADVSYLHDQLIQYTKNAGDKRIAIFVLSDHLHIIQGFTSDPDLEKTALNDPRLLYQAPEKSLTEETRARITIESLSQLARYLGTIPGRKNLIWFSSGFRTNAVQYSGRGGGNSSFNLNAEVKDMTNLFSQNRIAVYPVDARGVQIDTLAQPTTVTRSGRGAAATLRNSDNTIADQNATENTIGDDTGGRALHNSNDLKGAVAKVMADGSSFYTLAYRPTATKSADGYHAIEVKLRQKGYTLAYRHGYYTTAAETTAGTDPTAMRAAAANQLALQHGAPGPMDVLFTAAVVPMAGAPANDIVTGNQAGKSLKGPYQVFTVNTGVAGNTVLFAPQPDGRLRLHVQFIAMVYSPDGELVNKTSRTMDSLLTPETVKTLQTNGVRLDQEISVPVKGDYFVRIAVRDLAQEKMGAIEIPIQNARKLTALERPPAK